MSGQPLEDSEPGTSGSTHLATDELMEKCRRQAEERNNSPEQPCCVSERLWTDGLLQNKKGDTSVLRKLFKGVRDGCLKLIQEAIIDGVDVNAINFEDQFPLLIAVMKGFEPVIRILLDNGANVNMTGIEDRITPLHEACMRGNKRIVDILLMRNANVNVFDRRGETPLHYACWRNYLYIVKKLLQKGANVNVSDVDAQTPLMIACVKGADKIVTALLESGANIEMRDSTGYFALHYACMKPNDGNVLVINSLLQRGFDIDSTEDEQNTALHIACQAHDVKVVEALLNKGANANPKNIEGKTPLHLVIQHSTSIATVDLLLDKGANINAVDNNGYTPLHLAAQKSSVQQIKKLIQKGALVNIKNIHDKTPYDIVARNPSCFRLPLITFTAHIMKLNLAGLLVDVKCNPAHLSAAIQLEIQKEFEEIKAFKVTEHFSLEEIFTRVRKPYYMLNRELMDKLNKFINCCSSGMQEKFPYFYDVLENTFNLSQTRFGLLVQASHLCVWCFKDLQLDALIVEKIIDYLPNEDLQNLINSVKSS